MFTNISWGNYCTAIGVLLLGWYTFLGFRFYYKELKQIVSGERDLNFPNMRSIKKKQSCIESHSDSSPLFSESFGVSKVIDELTSILLNAIIESKERNLSKEEFQMYLKLILNDYPDAKDSIFRSTINTLMVSECEKHPQLILTYAEVDGLWDETI
ncbi:hypothetical protein [Flavobacterium granuli]|uniref:Uncharacterized protein n=1 Tax=Flavobacterium granuli TaxID=280093 RepID=A0ABU1S3H4_9FLAO|nr:hypothetical protein [Flavobacterium granuli]MDR6845576.1 hypothetical protein [Flavobacterium granuli]